MALITFPPNLARKLISPREKAQNKEKYNSIEKEIQKGNWESISPIWITPNLLINGIFCGFRGYAWTPTFKPFIIYNGHHRFNKALEHNLPIKTYIKYTPKNPIIPEGERLKEMYYQ